ncbi:hypothetical protein SCALM49S_03974 [Streptomyces californicus]
MPTGPVPPRRNPPQRPEKRVYGVCRGRQVPYGQGAPAGPGGARMSPMRRGLVHVLAWTLSTGAAVTLSWWGVHTVLSGTLYDRPRAVPVRRQRGRPSAPGRTASWPSTRRRTSPAPSHAAHRDAAARPPPRAPPDAGGGPRASHRPGGPHRPLLQRRTEPRSVSTASNATGQELPDGPPHGWQFRRVADGEAPLRDEPLVCEPSRTTVVPCSADGRRRGRDDEPGVPHLERDAARGAGRRAVQFPTSPSASRRGALRRGAARARRAAGVGDGSACSAVHGRSAVQGFRSPTAGPRTRSCRPRR